MNLKIVVFLVVCLFGSSLCEETDLTKSETDTEGDVEAPEQEVTYYTKEWTELYTSAALKNQPKWTLADTQPESGAYQTRIYPMQWWITSFVPCRSQLDTQSFGYMSLYIYFNGNNYQTKKYNLTYPVVMEVDHRKPEKKSAKAARNTKGKEKASSTKYCSEKYTEKFYLPIEVTESPWSIYHRSRSEVKTKLVEEESYYVREYSGNHTMAYCNEQAYLLGSDLIKDNLWFDENVWYCAGYEPPIGQTEQKQEVWIKVKKIS